jgi:hypothetical protein
VASSSLAVAPVGSRRTPDQVLRMTIKLRVLSVYEGFFTGGARILHSGVVAALHARRRHVHSVLSIHEQMLRDSQRQTMCYDASYQQLRAVGVPVATLGRTPVGAEAFTDNELAIAARHLASADVVLSL